MLNTNDEQATTLYESMRPALENFVPSAYLRVIWVLCMHDRAPLGVT